MGSSQHAIAPGWSATRKLADVLKIRRCGLRAFRNTHASLLLHTGATPKVVQEKLRHADPRVTLGMYSHVIGEDRRNAVERVAVLLRPTEASCAQLRPNQDLKRSGFNKLVGAGDGNRTHVRGLGSRYSTIEPRPLGPTLPDRSRFRQVSAGNEFSPHNASRDCLLRSFFTGFVQNEAPGRVS